MVRQTVLCGDYAVSKIKFPCLNHNDNGVEQVCIHYP